MKPIALIVICLLTATLTGCAPTQPKLVPTSPHGGTLFVFPEGKGRLEVVREDNPDKPDKVQITVYFLNEEFKPLDPMPTAVSFKPKSPKNAPKVELKPTGDPDPAKASGLASTPLENSGSVAGEISATIGGNAISIPINVR
jgi:hypothetical protein